MLEILSRLNNYTTIIVAIGAAVLGMISGVIGSYSVIRKQSLIGDGVSHSALPGVVLAFMLTGNKSTEVLLLGALVAGILAASFIIGIVKNSRIKFDSALALVMSVFFGAGLVLLSVVQKTPASAQAGLSRFIFGQVSAILERDVYLMIGSSVVLLVLVLLFWKEFKLFSFDPEYAHTLGFKPMRLNLLLMLMTVLTIIIGLQTVGVILMSAMLIAPGVAARQWTDKLWLMSVLSAGFGAGAGVIGAFASSLTEKLPTGPAIVVVISIFVLMSILFAPKRGLISRAITRKKARKEWAESSDYHSLAEKKTIIQNNNETTANTNSAKGGTL